MATMIFKDKREANYKLVSGVDSITVSVDFQPNFIQAVLLGVQTKPADPATGGDSVVLTSVTATATGYDVVFDYNCGQQRTVKWVVAKLPVDPEQTISF